MNANCVNEEVSRIFNSGNACYHSIQNLLSSCLLPRSVTVYVYIGICVSVFIDVDIKVKDIPVPTWTDSLDSRWLRLSEFLRKSAYESGKIVSLAHRPPLFPVRYP